MRAPEGLDRGPLSGIPASTRKAPRLWPKAQAACRYTSTSIHRTHTGGVLCARTAWRTRVTSGEGETDPGRGRARRHCAFQEPRGECSAANGMEMFVPGDGPGRRTPIHGFGARCGAPAFGYRRHSTGAHGGRGSSRTCIQWRKGLIVVTGGGPVESGTSPIPHARWACCDDGLPTTGAHPKTALIGRPGWFGAGTAAFGPQAEAGSKDGGVPDLGVLRSWRVQRFPGRLTKAWRTGGHGHITMGNGWRHPVARRWRRNRHGDRSGAVPGGGLKPFARHFEAVTVGPGARGDRRGRPSNRGRC